MDLFIFSNPTDFNLICIPWIIYCKMLWYVQEHKETKEKFCNIGILRKKKNKYVIILTEIVYYVIIRYFNHCSMSHTTITN